MKNKRNSKLILSIVLGFLIMGLSGCAIIRDKLATIRGDLIGVHFNISTYDHYANKILSVEGSKITVGLLENDANNGLESTGFESSVLEITINGNKMLQVSNTAVLQKTG
ncbi:DUF5052 family protein [Tissierella sp. MB52-C2]|uniref:DUF5052 family protein n=1 Tax=Tissierella sp. MB52-C2 TaxID=3070999 RepID=UPI00280C0B80|nr:DUF5052 family protein [Tissierella sp. MB52-C2]WMM23309.1 DUF5052 family protein [Tissierella sp. MB52-C2]